VNKSLVAIGLCVAMLVSALNVPAQTTVAAGQAWDDLRQLSVNQALRVERKDGKKFSGLLNSCTATELLMERKGRVETFPRAEVRRVWRVGPPNRTKQQLFTGLGVGAGIFAGLIIGVGLGFKQCGSSCADEKAGILGAIVGLPVAGGVAGRALAGRGKHTLIYVAP
jgi:hypothetical protein